MRVFTIHSQPDEYATLLHTDERNADLVPDFDGSPLPDWQRVPMYWEREERGDPVPDHAVIAGGGSALSARAVEALGDLLGDAGELLPVDIADDGERADEPTGHQILNVTSVSDALDEEASTVKRFRDDGTVRRILEYAFKPASLQDAAIFKIAQRPEVYTYVTDTFVDRVAEHGLTGFEFRPVWSDEEAAAA